MSPFRRRGRARAPAAPPPEAQPALVAAAGVSWTTPVRGAGPATLAARPAPHRLPTDDPPTDPFGWPAVPGVPGEGPTVTVRRPGPGPEPSPGPRTATGPGSGGGPGAAAVPGQQPDRGAAAGLAAAFAADYLSWDEADPTRRGQVLAGYLREPGPDPTRLGWNGRGRQRAELVLPGLVRPDSPGRVLVEVRVRVTPYRSIGASAPAVQPAEGLPGEPAVAPAPAGRGWQGLATRWIRLTVPVVVDGDRLVVDEWRPGPDRPAEAEP